jgi:sporulenol synthase
MNVSDQVNGEIGRLTDQLLEWQAQDGSWRFCFENGALTDAYMIIVLRTLEIADERLIRQLHDRLLATQHSDGSWRVYDDEAEGNLSTTVECYYALLYSGYSRETDTPVVKAKRFILSRGGLQNVSGVLTKVRLCSGAYDPDSFIGGSSILDSNKPYTGFVRTDGQPYRESCRI